MTLVEAKELHERRTRQRASRSQAFKDIGVFDVTFLIVNLQEKATERKQEADRLQGIVDGMKAAWGVVPK